MVSRYSNIPGMSAVEGSHLLQMSFFAEGSLYSRGKEAVCEFFTDKASTCFIARQLNARTMVNTSESNK